jgi:two-component system chemotaxis response regulator CheB
MGLQAIKKMGGTVIIEDPSTAQFAGMPEAALATKTVDFQLKGDEIGSALVSLVTGSDTP